jgi:DNA helicase-2/ATP-dependent DNA helicase PcrA
LTSKSIDNEEKLYFLKELNENQREAVTCEDKRICVVAGPGCGKTKTLVSRVIYLLKSKIATPDQILLLTFSKKAIKEIKERIKDSLGSKPGSVINVSNIHSFCCKFLRRHIFLLGVKDNKFAIYDRKDQEEVVRQILEDMDLALYSDKKEVKAIVNSITQCKSKGMTNFVVLNDL